MNKAAINDQKDEMSQSSFLVFVQLVFKKQVYIHDNTKEFNTLRPDFWLTALKVVCVGNDQ